ncbi:MAG: hypothetical protein AAF411_17635 [Myxococcota bacterium]
MRPALLLAAILSACGGSYYTSHGTGTPDDDAEERCTPTSLGETSEPACDDAIEGASR